MAKRGQDISSSFVDEEDNGYAMQPSRKRMKVFEAATTTTLHHRAPRRNSTINTTFNACNSPRVAAPPPPLAASPSGSSMVRPTSTLTMDSREQPDEDSMEYYAHEEMRDLTETMRDIVCERGCTKTC